MSARLRTQWKSPIGRIHSRDVATRMFQILSPSLIHSCFSLVSRRRNDCTGYSTHVCFLERNHILFSASNQMKGNMGIAYEKMPPGDSECTRQPRSTGLHRSSTRSINGYDRRAHESSPGTRPYSSSFLLFALLGALPMPGNR